MLDVAAGAGDQTLDAARRVGLPAASFDAAVCRRGLMFCSDPIESLQGMHHALKPGSCACVMVFSQPVKNPCIGVLLQTAFKHARRFSVCRRLKPI